MITLLIGVICLLIGALIGANRKVTKLEVHLFRTSRWLDDAKRELRDIALREE